MDEFPKFFRGEAKILGRFKVPRKMMLTLTIAIIAFLLGIITVTEGGLHWFNLYNNYSAYYGHFFTYKWRLNKDIKLMIGFEPNIYFKVMWSFFTPAVIFAIFVFAMINIPSNPGWFDQLGICMSWSVFAPVPLYALYKVTQAWMKGEPVGDLLRPNSKWRPDDHSIKYDHIKGPVDQGDINAIAYPNSYSQNVTDDIP